MENVIVLGFARNEQAEDALAGLRDLHRSDELQLEVAAVIQRTPDGGIDVRDLAEEFQLRVTAAGGVVGALIGLLTGPMGVLLGGATGAAVGSLVDVADTESADDVLRWFGQDVQPGSAATIAVAHERSPAAVNKLASNLGATLLRRRLADVERELLEAEEAVLAARRDDEAKRTLGERLRDVKDAVLDRH
jgi:uncharacterized membrane protein